MTMIEESYARLALTDVRSGRNRLRLLPHETSTWMDVRTALEAMLTGDRGLPFAPFIPLDADTARIIANHGIHPLALAMLADQRTVRVQLPTGRIKAGREGDYWQCGIPIGRSGRWRGRRMTIDRLPATLAASIETGLPLPLRDMVDDPSLAGVGVEVVSLHDLDGSTILEFAERPPCGAIAMVEIWRASVAARERGS